MKKKRELRTIWNSNGLHTNSGYGVEMQLLLPRLARDGWPIGHIAFWGLDGTAVEFKDYPGIKIYPKMGEPFGADAMFHHSRDYKADAVMSFQDLPPLNPQFLQQLKTWIPWVPIDKTPVPPEVLTRLRYAYKIVTFSKFGQQELEKAGFTSTLILEGTDTEIYKPMDKTKARKELGIPENIFLFGMVAANKENPPRKGFQEALEAFKLFHDKHPEAGIIFLNQQEAPGNFPIKGFAQHLGILANCYFIDPYKSIHGGGPQEIPQLMNTFDILLHPSQTEGFGLTVIEAGACGVPVVVNDCTSMPEMVVQGVTGGICKSGKPRWATDNAWVYPADVDSLYEQMEIVYNMLKTDPEKVKKDCREHIVKNYNIETTAKKWTEVLEDLQEDLLTTPEKPDTIPVAK